MPPAHGGLQMRVRPALATLMAIAALGAAGCGGSDDTSTPTTAPTTTSAPPAATTAPSSGNGDTAAGKQIFTANFSGCHTLADANATGTVGPNLDQLKPDQQRVATQVTNGGGVMPAFAGQLSDTQIQDVAAYVAAATGG